MAPAKKVSSPSDAVDEQLERYRSMRDFSVTAEPSGKAKANQSKRLPFCIQKHEASHLHYDFRLGWNGVLKSWACAKGPSYNVKDRRLAVQVEDHPIEYGGFEGIIPQGQYGGGTVMLWDQGTWEPQAEYPDVDAGLREGHLKFVLHGTKLEGKWALIRMKPRSAKETKPNWLLIKEHDEFERRPDDEPVTEAETKSVVTHRSMQEIAASKDHVWNSKGSEKDDTSAAMRRTNLPPGLPEEHQPSFLKPQLAIATSSPPEGAGWLHELKLDGYRIQARKDGAKVLLLTRSGLEWTARMQGIAARVAKLPCNSATLDGEVVVLADDGNTSFAELQAAFQDQARHPLTYFCFDLLHLDGRSTRELPLLERKQLLENLLKDAGDDLRFSEHLVTSPAKMFEQACKLHAEGIVSKRISAPYSGLRNADWVKSKCRHEQEFVIGGYTLPGKGKAGGPGIGALLLGFYNDSQKLIYAGRTGTGFSQKVSASLRKELERLVIAKSPFQSIASEAQRAALWVKPTLVAQVHFATWTADRQVRQAAFLGLREDKQASTVQLETSAPAKRVSNPSKPQSGARSKPSEASEPITMHLTHPDKVLDSASGLTKQQLADYYWAVSANMLPHVAGRPLSLVRVPDGIGKEQFFQKHMNLTLPPGLEPVDVPDKKSGKVEKYITLNTREAIASLAQISVLEVHPWGSLGTNLEKPDRLVIDLDPDDSLAWATLAEAAAEVRKEFRKLGLESFLKTTGGKGLHVVVPIEPRLEWPDAKKFCHDFVLKMEAAHPARYLTKMTKAARVGKIYLDYLRNERGATAVAPWSPRARPEVGVAVPLMWSELHLPNRPVFTVKNFTDWRGRLSKDPWIKMFTTTQDLTRV